MVTINESFNGTTAPGWVLGGSGYTPVLTASQGIDPAGSGWLRLTSNGGNQATYAYDTTGFNGANSTIAVQFSYASYNGTGADGITFFLADASKTFGVGAYGGSLGYAQKTAAGGGGADINGMNGGYIGLGIDEYGNYANATEGRIGGIGASPNAISVRGPGQGLTGYEYLGGTGSLTTPLAFPTSTTRPTGTNARSVQIVITATNQLTVYLQTGTGGPYVPQYSVDLSGYARPDQLIMGFTGSTGGSTDIHEIQNVNLSSVAANLWTNAAGTSTWGTTAANWNGTVAPATGADILLDNTYVSGAQTIDVGQNRIVRSVQIDAPFAYTLNNGSLEFNNNGVLGPSGILVSETHGAAAHTVNSNLVADNAIELKNGSTGSLNLTGNLATNGNTVTLDGSGATTLSGVVSGTGNVVKNDAGNATLSGANSYSGGTTVNAGTLTANNNGALGSGGLTLNGGTLASTNNSSVANAITLQGNAGLSGLTTAGALTQTGGSYTLNLANATQSGAVSLSNNNTGRTLTAEVDGGTATISGVIQNGGTAAGSLAKSGAGTLVLSGAHTYTGTTTISNGTIQLGASNVLADTSSLSIGAAGTLNLNGFSDKVGSLAAAGGATLDFGTPTGANTFVFGTYTAPTSGVLVVNNWQQGVDTLASTVGGQTVNTIYLSGYGAAQEAATTSGTLYGNAYVLTPVAQTGVIWAGSSSSSWGTNANWVSGSRPTSTQIAVFDSTGAARPNVNLNNSYTVAGIKFDTTAPTYSVTGSNTLTLSGTVPYIQQKSASGQTLAFTTLALAGNTVTDISGAGSLTISSALAGSGNLIKDGTGSGKLILSGNSTGYTGNIFVNNGVLQVTANNALGSSTTGSTTVSGGAALEFNGSTVATAKQITFEGSGIANTGALRHLAGTTTLSGALTLANDGRINADSGTLNLTGNLTSAANANLTLGGAGSTIVSGTITTGTGAVTKDGTGTVTFAGTAANTYTGVTTVNAGTLVLGKTAGVNAVAGDLDIEGGVARLGASNQIADASMVTINGTGTLDLNNQSETVARLNGTSSSAAVTLGSGSLTVSSAAGSSYAGSIGGSGTLTKAGSGELDLSGSSNFSGGTNLQSGIISISNGSALGTGTVTVANSGNLQMQGNITVANALNLTGNGTYAGDGAVESYAGTNTLSGNVTLAGNSRIQSDAGGTMVVTGPVAAGANTLNVGGAGNTLISGVVAGTGALTKDGTGTLTLSGANTYTGGTTINAGRLELGASERLADTGSVVISSGATFDLNGYTETIGALSGSGTLQLAGGTLIAGSGGASSTFSGAFVSGDTGTFEKTGAGTLTFGSALNLTNGSLVLNGGTLGLGGYSSSFGSLTVTANSTLDFGGTSILNLNSLTVNSGVTLTVTNWTDTIDYFYSILNPGSGTLGRIVFSGYSAGSTKWQSFDKQITPVPEPSTYGAIFTLLGLGVCIWIRRRRSKGPLIQS